MSLSLKTLRQTAQNISNDSLLMGIATQWMVEREKYGGCTALNHSISSFPELSKDFVATMGKFCPRVDDQKTFFLDSQVRFFQHQEDFNEYLIELVPLLPTYLDTHSNKEILATRFIINAMTQLSDLTYYNNQRLRITLLNLVTESWLINERYYQAKTYGTLVSQIVLVLKLCLSSESNLVK